MTASEYEQEIEKAKAEERERWAIVLDDLATYGETVEAGDRDSLAASCAFREAAATMRANEHPGCRLAEDPEYIAWLAARGKKDGA